jgi:hypothetical protein
MAGTKRYKVTPTNQRVTWKSVPTTRGNRLKQVTISGTAVHVSPSTPFRIDSSANIPEDLDDAGYIAPLNLPQSKVSKMTIDTI